MNPTQYTIWEWICWRWLVLTHWLRYGGYSR